MAYSTIVCIAVEQDVSQDPVRYGDYLNTPPPLDSNYQFCRLDGDPTTNHSPDDQHLNALFEEIADCADPRGLSSSKDQKEGHNCHYSHVHNGTLNRDHYDCLTE